MKILIFATRSDLRNNGGPSGYLYNISEYLKSHPSDEMFFLPEYKLSKKWSTRLCSLIEILINKIPYKPRLICYLLSVWSLYFREFRFSKESMNFLNSFDVIHVHFPAHMIQNFAKNKIRGKLILTSHCPEPHNDEWAAVYGCREFLFKHKRLRNFLLKRELKAYDICDKIMFPVSQAKEPYEVASPLFKAKFEVLNDKFFYVPTALSSTQKIKENDNTLDNYNIKEDALRICYIGRHNKVKGYDFLKSIAPKVWKNIPDAFFIIGGKEEPLKGLEDKRWIEMGWVNPAKLLNEVDVFILPNQNTYFDIILLEILRQGTPVILSRTGGNKWFENKKVQGLRFFEYGNTMDLLDQIKDINRLKKNGELKGLIESNLQFFQQEFNMKLYLERYLNSLKTIISE